MNTHTVKSIGPLMRIKGIAAAEHHAQIAPPKTPSIADRHRAARQASRWSVYQQIRIF